MSAQSVSGAPQSVSAPPAAIAWRRPGRRPSLPSKKAARAFEAVAAEPAEELLACRDRCISGPTVRGKMCSTECRRRPLSCRCPPDPWSARWRCDVNERTVPRSAESERIARWPRPAGGDAHRQSCDHAERAAARRRRAALVSRTFAVARAPAGMGDARGADAHRAAAELGREREGAGRLAAAHARPLRRPCETFTLPPRTRAVRVARAGSPPGPPASPPGPPAPPPPPPPLRRRRRCPSPARPARRRA